MELCDNANGVIGVKNVINLTDMFLAFKNLKQVSLSQSVKKNTISVVELVYFALLNSDNLCGGLVFLQRKLGIILWQHFMQLM